MIALTAGFTVYWAIMSYVYYRKQSWGWLGFTGAFLIYNLVRIAEFLSQTN